MSNDEPAPDEPPDATRRDDNAQPSDGGTRRENSSSPDGFTPTLPSSLADRYVVIGSLPVSGAEADLALVEARTTREQFILKIYRHGIEPDEDAVARLAHADPSHVVRIVESGWAGQRWWELLERCAPGSLRSLMLQLSQPDLTEVVTEMATALSHVHQLGIVHRDLKPENVLVRSVLPLDLVLGDFGLVRTVGEASVRWTRAWGTPAYSPPEFESGEVTAAWDWWSLGMIVAEIAGGRHPFEQVPGGLLSDQQIRAWLAQRPVDLSAVADNRIVLLCQGLLTRDRRDRWTGAQVQAWLAGETPAVVRTTASVTTPDQRRSVLFRGIEHHSGASLANGFQAEWAVAAKMLFQERDPTLIGETERLLRAEQASEALHLLQPAATSAEIPRRMAMLLIELNPDLEPRFNGIDVTPQGLEIAVLDLIKSEDRRTASHTIAEIRSSDVLTIWRMLDGMSEGPAIHERWNRSHAEIATHLTELPAGRELLAEPVVDLWLLACAISDAHFDSLRQVVHELAAGGAGAQAWWSELYRLDPSTPASQTAALVSEPIALEQTNRAREEQLAIERQREAERVAAMKAAEAKRILEAAVLQETRRELILGLRNSRIPQLAPVIDDLPDDAIERIWPAIERIEDVVISSDYPLKAWELDQPYVGVLLLCTDGVVCVGCRYDDWSTWRRRSIVGAEEAAGGVTMYLKRAPQVSFHSPSGDHSLLLAAITQLSQTRNVGRLLELLESWSAGPGNADGCCAAPSVGTCAVCQRLLCVSHTRFRAGRHLCDEHRFMAGPA